MAKESIELLSKCSPVGYLAYSLCISDLTINCSYFKPYIIVPLIICVDDKEEFNAYTVTTSGQVMKNDEFEKKRDNQIQKGQMSIDAKAKIQNTAQTIRKLENNLIGRIARNEENSKMAKSNDDNPAKILVRL